jgi:hypothetical protein
MTVRRRLPSTFVWRSGGSARARIHGNARASLPPRGRRQARRKSFGAPFRAKIADESSVATHSALSAMYANVLKLSTENVREHAAAAAHAAAALVGTHARMRQRLPPGAQKINQKNSWQLPLIDHIDRIIEEESAGWVQRCCCCCYCCCYCCCVVVAAAATAAAAAAAAAATNAAAAAASCCLNASRAATNATPRRTAASPPLRIDE